MNTNHPKPSILIVDDRSENVIALEGTLSVLDLDCVKAYSGEEALQRALDTEFACILLDVQMPGMDGFETADLLRGTSKTSHIPLIFITAICKDEIYVSKGYSAGAVDYLSKPIDPAILTSKVRVLSELYRQKKLIEKQADELRRTNDRLARSNEELATTMRELEETNTSLHRKNAELDENLLVRLQTEEALRQKEGQIRQLVEGAPDAIVISDRDGRITLVNAQTEVLFGYSRAELDGQSVELLIPERFGGKHREVLDGGAVTSVVRPPRPDGTLLGRRNDGREFPVEISLSPVRTEQGVMVVSAIRDVTDRKRIEAQLMQSQKMDAIGKLAGGIAHDFNNLLGVISGYASSLARELEGNEALSEDVHEIQCAARRAAELTRRILAVARKEVVQPRVLQLNDVVSDIEKLLQRTIGRDIELVTHLEPELPNIVVDPSQIEQILLNLAVNSRDAMPLGGKLIIRTAKASFDEDYIERHPYVTVGIYVELEVSDTGCGMSKDVRSRVFEPFFTTKERGKGTGLGMAVVHGCVKQLGGSIEIYSEPELGTTIRIYIPSTEESSADPVPRPKKILMRGRGETVLVVEDEEALLKLAVRVLARNGYVVHQALDGSDALRIIEQHEGPIHLLLTDVVMPGLSGKDLARSVREALPNIKVLYVSGYAGEVIEQHGLVERSERLLQKPFSEADLLSAVGEILQMEGLT